jgi:hypothetical protein
MEQLPGEETYLDRDNGFRLKDGTVIRPSSVTIPGEIEQRIDSLLGAAGRRQADIDRQTRDRGKPDVHPDAGQAAILRELWDEIRADLRDYWKDEWTRRRRLGIAKRGESVKERLARPPEIPDWLRLLPDDVLKPKQREAMVYRHGYGLSIQEAADAADISKSAMAKRLRLAEPKVERYWGARDPAGDGYDILLHTALRMAYRLRTWDAFWDTAIEARNPVARAYEQGARDK